MPPSTRSRGRWIAPTGERTSTTRAAHAADTTAWKRALRDAEFPPEARVRFLDLLREQRTVKAAAEDLGITTARVYGRMKWDEAFAAEVDEILAATCLGGDQCGTEMGYRYGGRCADCRAAKHATRGHPSASPLRNDRPPADDSPDPATFGRTGTRSLSVPLEPFGRVSR
jgi:hypothetical protein